MLDDNIKWCRDPKDFEGFSIRKNGKERGYDVFGMLKGTGIWLRVGYMCMVGRDRLGGKLFMLLMCLTVPYWLCLIWF